VDVIDTISQEILVSNGKAAQQSMHWPLGNLPHFSSSFLRLGIYLFGLLRPPSATSANRWALRQGSKFSGDSL